MHKYSDGLLVPYYTKDEWPEDCFILDHGAGMYQAVYRGEFKTGKVASRVNCEKLIDAKLRKEMPL